MKCIVELMNAISWPIAVLIFGVVAAFGGLNKPLSAISAAFGGIFKDLNDFKKELSNVEGKLAEVAASMPEAISKIADQVADIETTLSKKLGSIQSEIQSTRNRLLQESLADEVEVGSILSKPNLISDPTEADRAIALIVEAWAKVKTALEEKYADAANFDKREYGQAVRTLANGSSDIKPSIAVAERVASLHSRFKGFTRRRAYAIEWLTTEMVDSYLGDTTSVIQDM